MGGHESRFGRELKSQPLVSGRPGPASPRQDKMPVTLRSRAGRTADFSGLLVVPGFLSVPALIGQRALQALCRAPRARVWLQSEGVTWRYYFLV